MMWHEGIGYNSSKGRVRADEVFKATRCEMLSCVLGTLRALSGW